MNHQTVIPTPVTSAQQLREQAADVHQLVELQRVQMDENASPSGFILHDSICKTGLKRQNYRNRKKICGCWGIGESVVLVGKYMVNKVYW